VSRCLVLDAGAMTALGGRPERRHQEVRAALRAAERLDREVAVPAVVLAELYRGPRHNQQAIFCKALAKSLPESGGGNSWPSSW
jgi:predicted nucleic acid-binding protein